MFPLILHLRNINSIKISCFRLTHHISSSRISNTSTFKSLISKTYCQNLCIGRSLKQTSSKLLTIPITSSALVAGYLYWCNTNSAKCDSQTRQRRVEDDRDTPDDEINKIYETAHEAYSSHELFNWQRLADLLRPDAFYLVIAVVSSLFVAFLNIQIPLSLGSVMNVLSRFATEGSSVWTNEFLNEIKSPSFKVMEMYIFQSIFTFVYISSLSIVGEKLASRLRQQLFTSLIRLDVSFYDNQKTGEVISRITTDVQDFKSSFKMCVSQGLRSATQIIGCAISLFIISPKMTILMSTIIPAMVVTGSYLGSLLREKSKEAQAQVAKASGIAFESISNIRTVKALAMEDVQSRVYNKEILYAEELNCNLGIGIGAFQGMVNLALNGIVLGNLLFGGYLLTREEISPGNLMSFLIATQTIQRSLSQLSLLFGNYVRGMAAGTRIFSYLDMKPLIPLKEGLILSPGKLKGDIVFNDVTFSYPTRELQNVLEHFNLRLMPGKITAICGLSGSGKTTIATLIERFYDINNGSITIDGVDLRSLDLFWLRGEAIGFINQEPVLFGTSIKENIRFGKLDATDEQVYRAAKIANADSFIRSFPEGYETIVGERGVALSGGQKQRIAIARAIIKNPSILILDEATSALDAESESLVQDALDKVMKGRTVLVIAHRLSTIQNADVIAVMANGKIVESGNHNSLKKLQGRYWQLIRQQSNDSDRDKDRVE